MPTSDIAATPLPEFHAIRTAAAPQPETPARNGAPEPVLSLLMNIEHGIIRTPLDVVNIHCRHS